MHKDLRTMCIEGITECNILQIVFVLEWARKYCGKGKKCGLPAFFPFSIMLSKLKLSIVGSL